MKIVQNAYLSMTAFSASIAITVQAFVFHWLANAGITSTWWIFLVTASGTYLSIYQILVWIYKAYGWKILLKRYYIAGKWYHEFRSEIREDYIRLGITFIHQTALQVFIQAQNYNTDFKPETRTLWQSHSLDMDEKGCITLAYQSQRAQSGAHSNEGIMHVQIEWDSRGKPIRLVGEFADSSPSPTRGSITWTRGKPHWVDAYDQMMTGN